MMRTMSPCPGWLYDCVEALGRNSLHTSWWIYGPGLTHSHLKANKQHTARCRYNVVNFCPNPNKRHPIACPLGRVMGCLLWIKPLMHILPQSLSYHMQNPVMMDLFITALDCTSGLVLYKINYRYIYTLIIYVCQCLSLQNLAATMTAILELLCSYLCS